MKRIIVNQKKSIKIMTKGIIKVLTICLVLSLTNCSSNHTEPFIGEIKVEVSDAFLENLKAFQRKTQRVIDTLESNTEFSNVDVMVKSEFGPDSQNLSTFVLSLQYSEASNKDEKTLHDLGLETLQKALEVMKASSYAKCEIRFLDDTKNDEGEFNIMKSFVFPMSEFTV
jgi:hypothetical protein